MLFNQIKTASQLKSFVDNSESCKFFFSKDTLSFFGDTMRNYRIIHHLKDSDLHYVELERVKPVKHGLYSSEFFALKTGSKTEVIRLNGYEQLIRNAVTIDLADYDLYNKEDKSSLSVLLKNIYKTEKGQHSGYSTEALEEWLRGLPSSLGGLLYMDFDIIEWSKEQGLHNNDNTVNNYWYWCAYSLKKLLGV